MNSTSRFVLLHGFTGSPDSFATLIPKLRGEAFAPALLGHSGEPVASEASDGEREETRSRGPFEAEVSRLAQLILTHPWRDGPIGARAEHLPDAPLSQPRNPQNPHGPPAPWLVGYSLGGRLALGLALRFPHVFSRVTLIGAHPGLESPDARRERCASDSLLSDMLEQRGLDPFLEHWRQLPLWESQKQLPQEVLQQQDQIRRQHHPLGLAHALMATGLGVMPDYWPQLADVDLHVDWVVGEHDTKFRALAERARQLLPRVALRVIPGVGHNVVLEAPEILAELLRVSYSRPPASAAPNAHARQQRQDSEKQ